MPWAPYYLRHAYAIRMLRQGVPLAAAARMMGHSVEVHTRTYHAWISRQDIQEVYRRSLVGEVTAE